MKTAWLFATLVSAWGGIATLAPATAEAAPKYFFQLQNVKAVPDADGPTRKFVAEALKDELSKRPEWASDLGPAGEARPGQDRGALAAELKKRNLRGFDVSAKIESFKTEFKEPRPGGKLRQLAVDVRLSVWGTTIPDAKLAFSGDGQAGLEAEVAEKRIDADKAEAVRDAIKDAIRQAVDQAVLKLAIGKSEPMNESRRRKKK